MIRLPSSLSQVSTRCRISFKINRIIWTIRCLNKSGQSVLLYGGDNKCWVNGNFITNSNLHLKEHPKFCNSSFDQAFIEPTTKDFSHIFMEGRKVFQPTDTNSKTNTERRNDSNGHKWFWDPCKQGKKCINCNYKIPFCLDVKTCVSESIQPQDYSALSNAKIINSVNAWGKVTERNYKLTKKNKRVQINKENELKYIESIKAGHRFK